MRAYLKPVLAVIIFLVLQVAVGTILAVFCSATNTKITDHPTLLALSIIVSGIITVAILWAMRMIKGKTFNPFRIDWKRAPLGIAAAASAIFAMDLLSEQINLPDLMELEFKELATNPWGILAIAVVGPIVEELVFREGIIRYLVRHGEHRKYAVLFSAVMFGLIHFNPAQVPFAIIMGIILGIIYVKSGSILLTSLIHILNNTAALIEMRLTEGTINEAHKLTEALGGPILAWIYIIVFSALSFVFMKTFCSKYRKKPAKTKKQEEKVKEYY